jgi:hypothetical protein
MEFSGDNTSVYAEAKGEYTRQLCQYLTPVLQKYFLDMIEIAKERESEPKKHLISFQTLLEGISEWNVDKVQRETQAVAISTQCDYLEELLTAVFIAHTKVLSAIRLTNKNKKLQITIPKLEHFLHRTLTECARLLWRNTFLFASTGTALERQKNMCQIENLIKEGILQGVRSMLPVKSILREYLSTEDTDEEDEEEEEEEEEPEPESKPEAESKPEPKKKDATVPTGPATPIDVPRSPATPIDVPTGPVDLNFSLKEFDVAAPPRPATPVPAPPATPPVVPTIILDGAPRVEFKETESFFKEEPVKVVEPVKPAAVLAEPVQELEEFDTSGIGESTSLDFTEFEEL